MSNKKFMNRSAFVLALFSLVCFGYCLYVTKVNTYKLEASIVQLEHIQNYLQIKIKSNLEFMRSHVEETTIEGK